MLASVSGTSSDAAYVSADQYRDRLRSVRSDR